MKIVVHDASVLIDLYHAGALDLWLDAGLEAWTTDLVFLEVEQTLQPQRASGALRVKSYSAEELFELQTARPALPATLSLEDCSVLLLAQALGALLVTGDRELRRAAGERGVEVHGLLWILDELVASAACPPTRAAQMLEKVMQTRARLPATECALRLERWRGR
ncbi:MAG: hypothetical protein JSR82_17170 [Verrucomicrobia bacterium]|nr:hypothetical protein [Verrucomicrobiota bacterium]